MGYVKDPVKQRQYYDTKKQSGYYRDLLGLWKKKAFNKLGNRCLHCGFTDPRALQIDHIYNDGYLERKLLKGSSSVGRYKRVLEDVDGRYQLLCANCNWIKRMNREEE